jgi:hypothetical protein
MGDFFLVILIFNAIAKPTKPQERQGKIATGGM